MIISRQILTEKDLTYPSGDRLFFTSDSHWGHSRIIEFCKRPFSSVEEMNQKLIENWNSVVQPGDIVFHLGDFCWGGSAMWNSILDQLNGKIWLIKGNHDIKNLREGYLKRFEWVGYQLKITIEERSVYLNHFPFLCYDGTYRDKQILVYQLHGHTHLCEEKVGQDYQRLLNAFPTQLDVGVDANNYTPLSWQQVKEQIEYQIDTNQSQAQII